MDESAQLAAICHIWAEVLELPLERVLGNSHFLQLGGDSLHWTRMALRVQDRLGLALPAQPEPGFATPAELTSQCRRSLALGQSIPAPSSAQAQQSDTTFPANGMQQGLWFAEQLAGTGKLYQNAVLLHLKGMLDVENMQRAFQQVLKEVPILRANFFMDRPTRRLWGRYRPPAATERALPSCRNLAADALPMAIDQFLQLPMALERDPLFRAQLFRTDTTYFHLLLIAHHLVCDGWSGNLLLQRLAHAYTADRESTTDSGFATHAWRQSSVLNPEARGWWQEQLAGVERSQRWLWQGQVNECWPHAVAQRRMVFPPELCARCEASAVRAGVSPFILYQTACKLALWRLSGEARQVLAIPCAVRSPSEESAIGCFVELHLSVSRLRAFTSSVELLQKEAECFRQGRAAVLALPALAAELQPDRLPDGNAWTSVLFAFQNFPHFASRWPGLDCRVERLPVAHSQFALRLELLREAEGWCLYTEYATALFDARRLTCLESSLVASLEQLAD